MSTLLIKAQKAVQVHSITPETAQWEYVGFEVHDLEAGQQLSIQQTGRELCLVLMSGSADVTAKNQKWQNIGGRSDIFSDQPPAAVYIPAGEKVLVEAKDKIELAVCSAPGQNASGPARLLDPATMSQEVRGEGSNTRYVRNILPESEAADNLLVVEVVTPSGNWSSYPPHKHDRNALPQESMLEETYYHRLKPASGYVHQRVYTDDRSLDETLSPENRDVVLVPRGYHPVGVPHGYTSYYLNVMAGPVRKWHFYNDPAHEWILNS